MPYRAYDAFDTAENSARSGLECLDPSLTIQSQAEEADINVIVRNFGITGKLPQNIRVPQFGDFDSVDDYQTAIEVIRAAEESFAALPSEARVRFENNPQRFLEFCSDRSNLEEMRKLGLAVPAPEAPAA